MNTIVMMRNDAGTGAGSRGGKIIGRTKTGKPIYDSHGHAAHKGFTSAEHGHAANLHLKLADEQGKKKDKGTPESQGVAAAKEDHHLAQMKAHGASQRHLEQTKKKPATPQVPPPSGGKQALALKSR